MYDAYDRNDVTASHFFLYAFHSLQRMCIPTQRLLQCIKNSTVNRMKIITGMEICRLKCKWDKRWKIV